MNSLNHKFPLILIVGILLAVNACIPAEPYYLRLLRHHQANRVNYELATKILPLNKT